MMERQLALRGRLGRVSRVDLHVVALVAPWTLAAVGWGCGPERQRAGGTDGSESEDTVVATWTTTTTSGARDVGGTATSGATEPPRDLGEPEPPGPGVFGLHAKSGEACAWLDDGRARCWGYNDAGELGLGGTEQVGDDETIASVGDSPLGLFIGATVSPRLICAVLVDGHLRCAGDNANGQLGIASTERIGDDEIASDSPWVGLPGTVVAADAHKDRVCAIVDNGDVYCWGEARYLGLGPLDGNVGDDEYPMDVGPLDLPGPAREIEVDDIHACAVVEPGDIYCWGSNLSGELGLPQPDGEDFTEHLTPGMLGPVELDGIAVDVAVSNNVSCALLDDGRVRCWGVSLGWGPQLGAVGDDETPLAVPPVDVGFEPVSLSGGTQICALSIEGRVRCWPGSIGYPGFSFLDYYGHTPEELGDLELGEPATDVSSPCALLASGQVRCWGGGAVVAPLGVGTVGDDELPRDVPPIPVFE
jgi:hypothetical protein